MLCDIIRRARSARSSLGAALGRERPDEGWQAANGLRGLKYAVRQRVVVQFCGGGTEPLPNDNTQCAAGGRTFQIVSIDPAGKSWHVPTQILPKLAIGPQHASQERPGRGIQLRHPPHAGRLLFTGHPGVDPSCYGSTIWASDDGGASYKVLHTICNGAAPDCHHS